VAAILLQLTAQYLSAYDVAVFALGVCILAVALKKIRTSTDALGSVKRRWRALGYLSAGFFDWTILAVLVVLTAALVFVSGVSDRQDKPLNSPFCLDRSRLLSYLTVMFHHLHYFAYAYILVLIFVNDFTVPQAVIGALFYIGWLGYYLFIRANRYERVLVVGGHLLAASAVFLMFEARSLSHYLVLWCLTGIGGGTIVLLRELTIGHDEATYERFKTWESFGHVGGLLVLALAVLANVPHVSFVVSGCAGVLCALGAALSATRSKATME
jgi:hypothetical protein